LRHENSGGELLREDKYARPKPCTFDCGLRTDPGLVRFPNPFTRRTYEKYARNSFGMRTYEKTWLEVLWILHLHKNRGGWGVQLDPSAKEFDSRGPLRKNKRA